MRLTQIKLAGFKSFVDPMSIPVAGQLIGVVGPNGCGKSNIIDAVRWVLGESAAGRLRGESLQDVIFNGSGGRKPTSRASVELLFDNREGRAPGQWQTFSEIAVRRVLERNGESHFFINNIAVRKRDVGDLFLGTGVGARAYGIIEQGMVSRIVEARPEELRTFLEEAAGVSRYRERRKETESRLQDARVNLDRVEDVLRTLTEQIERLTTQAQAAQRYRDLSAELRQAQARLIALRAYLASEQARAAEVEMSALETAIEAQMAQVRSAEARVEALRQTQTEAADALGARQAALYAAGGEVARVEQAIGHLQQNRSALASRIAVHQQRLSDESERARQLEATAVAVGKELSEAKIDAETAKTGYRAGEVACNDAERTERAAQDAVDEAAAERQSARIAVQTAESEVRIVEQRRQATERQLERVAAELENLQPAGEAAADDSGAVEAARATLAEQQAFSARLQREMSERDTELNARREELAALVRDIAAAEARIATLAELRENAGAELLPWLASRGLDAAPRLLDGLRVRRGWERAFEAVLGQRLQARQVSMLDAYAFAGALPSTLSLIEPGAEQGGAGREGFEPLSTHILDVDESGGALASLLHGAYCADDVASAIARRVELADGELLVCPEGVLVWRHGLEVPGAVGDLSREGEWIEQTEMLQGMSERRGPLQEKLETLQATQRKQQSQWQELQQTLETTRAELQALEVEQARAREAANQAESRRETLLADRQRLAADVDLAAGELDAARAEVQSLAGELAIHSAALEECHTDLSTAREAAQAARELRRTAERSLQQAEFRVQTLQDRIADLANSRSMAEQTVTRLLVELEAMQTELRGLEDQSLPAALTAAVEARQQAETALQQTREAAEAATQALREAEQGRMAAEHAVGPLREQIGALRVRIESSVEMRNQQLALLAEMGVATSEVEVPESLEEEPLKRLTVRLQRDIDALGDVNLAAIGELTEATERLGFLREQAADLGAAIGTLEDAIRRIDRDSRERLRHTFEEVNRGLSELFPAMFGGGDARLELTGEEILDAGLLLTAHPPGKRNSSLALLSGGEKALTALALVFALFRLNPAPFCLLDEVDAPLDDTNTERFCQLVRRMSAQTQFLFITHNKVTMEMAAQLVGVTMPEPGVSRVVAVDVAEAVRLAAA